MTIGTFPSQLNTSWGPALCYRSCLLFLAEQPAPTEPTSFFSNGMPWQPCMLRADTSCSISARCRVMSVSPQGQNPGLTILPSSQSILPNMPRGSPPTKTSSKSTGKTRRQSALIVKLRQIQFPPCQQQAEARRLDSSPRPLPRTLGAGDLTWKAPRAMPRSMWLPK